MQYLIINKILYKVHDLILTMRANDKILLTKVALKLNKDALQNGIFTFNKPTLVRIQIT